MSIRLFIWPLIIAALFIAIFGAGLWEMVGWWARPEYNHGYAIPLISLYLIWCRSDELRQTHVQPSWIGLPLVLTGLLIFVGGELSALYVIIHYAFLLTLWGVVLTAIGPSAFRVVAPGLLYLVFMVPLPRFLQWTLTSELQLVSSELGATLLRLMGISVYLEGNIIDMGSYQLQVVEACSGLRYLVPLLSLGVFFALLYRGGFWQRAFIAASTVPITIGMNSFRIAVNGLLVNQFGIEAGEGFLHFFEGWIIFMACIAILLFEMRIMGALAGKRASELFDVRVPPVDDLISMFRLPRVASPVASGIVLLAAGLIAATTLSSREEVVPEHPPLRTFPMVIGDWFGTAGRLSDLELDQLQLSDYLLNEYRKADEGHALELYVAYYDSQRKGASAHSPRACIPGSGWEFSEFDVAQIDGAGVGGTPLSVNRAIISMADQHILVYYWFMQRGRNLTNEYMVKWYIFWDAITKGRTDGALVRAMTPVGDLSELADADRRLSEFLRSAEPRLSYYIPREVASETRVGLAGRQTQ